MNWWPFRRRISTGANCIVFKPHGTCRAFLGVYFMGTTLLTTQKKTITIEFDHTDTDGSGNRVATPVAVSRVAIALADPSVASLTTPDLSTSISSVDVVITALKAGTSTLVASGTNPDGTTVQGTYDIVVTEAGATDVKFTSGDAEAK